MIPQAEVMSQNYGENCDTNGMDDDDQVKPSSQASNYDPQKYDIMLKKLKESGLKLRSDLDQPIINESPPIWFQEDLFENAKSVYSRHFMAINFSHLAGLLLLVRVDSIFRTLSKTGESATVSKLFRRYYHTLRHVKTWYEGDIFEANSDAQRGLMIVRGMHNKVSVKLNDSDRKKIQRTTVVNDEEEERLVKGDNDDNNNVREQTLHISQYDIFLTQYAFVGFIVIKAKSMGLIDDFSRKDLESILHFWRVIGFYLGVNEEMNLCSYDLEDVTGLCLAIAETEYKQSMVQNHVETQPGLMSLNIVRSLKFIPMLTFYGMMRYLYELLEMKTQEIESRRTWYSNLSYTLIKLVMSNLLAYRPFRAFNNGLTRLSVYLVGKTEDWFAGRLESQYGQELRK